MAKLLLSPWEKLFLMVYADDFKLSGPVKAVTQMWKTFAEMPTDKRIILGKATELDQFLGCKHEHVEKTVNGRLIRGTVYNMQQFLVQGLADYEKLAGKDFKIEHADTPFTDEDVVRNDARSPAASKDGGLVCPNCMECYPTHEYTKAATPEDAKRLVETLRKAQMGVSLGHNKDLNGKECDVSRDEPEGVLTPIAASVVMKIFYCAREARPDMLRAIGHLTRFLTRWTEECDKRLHKLMCYVASSLEHRSVGWIGDTIEDLRLHVYSDSDFAGCQRTNKSTSGVLLVMEGPNSFYPIGFLSKMMGHVAYSTPESELAALAYALRLAGSPGMVMFETLSGRPPVPWKERPGRDALRPPAPTSKANPLPQTLIAHGDNSASICIVRSCVNKAIRHMGRTHATSLTWLHGQLKIGNYSLGYIGATQMAADIFTKFFATDKKEIWIAVCKLIAVYGKDKWNEDFGKCGLGHTAAINRIEQDDIVPKASPEITQIGAEDHQYVHGVNPFHEFGF